jgi:septal ring factor EnvC (AmiA/AmiB activator)
MTYDPDALRQMNDEAQMRIAELSTALGTVTDQRDNLQDSLDAAIKELDAYKSHVTALTSTVERLRLHIAQGVEL